MIYFYSCDNVFVSHTRCFQQKKIKDQITDEVIFVIISSDFGDAVNTVLVILPNFAVFDITDVADLCSKPI